MNSTVIFRQSGSSNTEAFHRIDLVGPERHANKSGTMLIVDDNNMLLNCLKMTAEKFFGCEVEAYLSPAQAWEAFMEDPGRYRCVITDYHMPQMMGGELIRRIHAACADMPIVLMSAAADPEDAAIDDDPFARFVRKPFDWDEVISHIEELESLTGFSAARTDAVPLRKSSNATFPG